MTSVTIAKVFGGLQDDAATAKDLAALIATAVNSYAVLPARIEELEAALRACRTSYCGFAITKNDQYPEVLASFWKEIQRIDAIASAALQSEKTT